jgi:hypothetical protein
MESSPKMKRPSILPTEKSRTHRHIFTCALLAAALEYNTSQYTSNTSFTQVTVPLLQFQEVAAQNNNSQNNNSLSLSERIDASYAETNFKKDVKHDVAKAKLLKDLGVIYCELL